MTFDMGDWNCESECDGDNNVDDLPNQVKLRTGQPFHGVIHARDSRDNACLTWVAFLLHGSSCTSLAFAIVPNSPESLNDSSRRKEHQRHRDISRSRSSSPMINPEGWLVISVWQVRHRTNNHLPHRQPSHSRQAQSLLRCQLQQRKYSCSLPFCLCLFVHQVPMDRSRLHEILPKPQSFFSRWNGRYKDSTSIWP